MEATLKGDVTLQQNIGREKPPLVLQIGLHVRAIQFKRMQSVLRTLRTRVDAARSGCRAAACTGAINDAVDADRTDGVG